MTSQRPLDEVEARAGLPRSNGELVFEAPWESRAFGIAVALEAQGRYAWRAFVDELTAEIAQADAAGDDSTYYQRWLASLERLLLKEGLITPEELEERTEEFASGLHDEDGHI